MVRLACLAAGLALVAAGCAAFEPGRSVGRQLDDFNASLAVKSAMMRAEGYALGGVDVEITEGVMLLSGDAPRDLDSIYAECVAWSAPAVRSVVNEIEVGEWRSPREAAADALITQQVRARLVQDREIRSVNFNIEARKSVVYLLGYARSRAEAERAAGHAALVSGVERVVDLTRVTGETPELPARGALQAEVCDAAGGAPASPAAPHFTPADPVAQPDAEPLSDGAPQRLEEPRDADPAAPRRAFEPEIDRTAPSEPAERRSSQRPPF